MPMNSSVGERHTTAGAGSPSAKQLSITLELSLMTRLGVIETIPGDRQTNSSWLRKLTGPARERFVSN